jgi:hypothetical protein
MPPTAAVPAACLIFRDSGFFVAMSAGLAVICRIQDQLISRFPTAPGRHRAFDDGGKRNSRLQLMKGYPPFARNDGEN